jgi:hypothetical protein
MIASEQLQLNRIALQMEAAYVFGTLVGVGSAWFIINVLTNMTDKALSSPIMLLMSLVAVCALFVCTDWITRADEANRDLALNKNGKDFELSAETVEDISATYTAPENGNEYAPPTFLNVTDDCCIYLEKNWPKQILDVFAKMSAYALSSIAHSII